MTRDELVRAVAEGAESARQLRAVADAAQDDYLAAVRAAQRAGVPIPELADAAGVSRTGLYQALRKRPEWAPSVMSAEERAVARRVERAAAVDDYRAARHADVVAQEARTGGYAGDIAHERAMGVRQPITYRQWLSQSKGGAA